MNNKNEPWQDKYWSFAFGNDKESYYPKEEVVKKLREIGEDKNKALLNRKHDEPVVRKFCKELLNGQWGDGKSWHERPICPRDRNGCNVHWKKGLI